MNDMIALTNQAKQLAKLDLVPSHYQGSPENIVAAIKLGRELGLSDMVMLNGSYPVNNRITLQPGLLMALVKKHPEYAGITVIQDDIKGCSLVLRRKLPSDVLEEYTSTFTEEDAKRAGLLGKAGGMYQKYPREMYYSRALSRAIRTVFPDVGVSQTYTPEELLPEMEPDRELRNVTTDPGATTMEQLEAGEQKIEVQDVPSDDPGWDELRAAALAAGYDSKYIQAMRKQWNALTSKPALQAQLKAKKLAIFGAVAQPLQETPNDSQSAT